MRVREHVDATGTWGLAAETGEYDAYPLVDRVLFDRKPRRLSPDRLALASFLIFGGDASATFETPSWHSPALAQALTNDVAPIWVQTGPVELYAKPLPVGRRRVAVTVEGLTDTPAQGAGAYQLTFHRSDSGSGSRVSFTSTELHTNAWLLGFGRDTAQRLRIALGCAVAFSEDVEADTLMLSCGDVDSDSEFALRQLLDAVRLGLVLT